MAIFGKYQTVRELHRGGASSVWLARLGERSKHHGYVVKVYEPTEGMATWKENSRDFDNFVAQVQVHQQVLAGGARCWAPIHDAGRTQTAAYYVTDRYLRSTERMIAGKVRLESRALQNIVYHVFCALQEIQRTCNRPHGNLKPSNVLLGGSRNPATSQVVVLDAAPLLRGDAPLRPVDDLHALGQLLYQLVALQPFKQLGGWPVRSGPEWDRLGKAGEQWLELCNRLLDPTAEAGLTLEALAPQILALRPPRAASPVKWLSAAAVLLVLAGLCFTAPVRRGVGKLMGRPSAQEQAGIDQLAKVDPATAWRELCLAYYPWLVQFYNEAVAPPYKDRFARDPDLAQLLQAIEKAHEQAVILNPTDIGGNVLNPDPEQPPAIIRSGDNAAQLERAYQVLFRIRMSLTTWPLRKNLVDGAKELRDLHLEQAAQELESLAQRALPPERAAGQLDLARELVGVLDQYAGLKDRLQRIRTGVAGLSAGAGAAGASPLLQSYRIMLQQQLAQQVSLEQIDGQLQQFSALTPQVTTLAEMLGQMEKLLAGAPPELDSVSRQEIEQRLQNSQQQAQALWQSGKLDPAAADRLGQIFADLRDSQRQLQDLGVQLTTNAPGSDPRAGRRWQTDMEQLRGDLAQLRRELPGSAKVDALQQRLSAIEQIVSGLDGKKWVLFHQKNIEQGAQRIDQELTASATEVFQIYQTTRKQQLDDGLARAKDDLDRLEKSTDAPAADQLQQLRDKWTSVQQQSETLLAAGWDRQSLTQRQTEAARLEQQLTELGDQANPKPRPEWKEQLAPARKRLEQLRGEPELAEELARLSKKADELEAGLTQLLQAAWSPQTQEQARQWRVQVSELERTANEQLLKTVRARHESRLNDAAKAVAALLDELEKLPKAPPATAQALRKDLATAQAEAEHVLQGKWTADQQQQFEQALVGAQERLSKLAQQAADAVFAANDPRQPEAWQNSLAGLEQRLNLLDKEAGNQTEAEPFRQAQGLLAKRSADLLAQQWQRQTQKQVTEQAQQLEADLAKQIAEVEKRVVAVVRQRYQKQYETLAAEMKANLDKLANIPAAAEDRQKSEQQAADLAQQAQQALATAWKDAEDDQPRQQMAKLGTQYQQLSQQVQKTLFLYLDPRDKESWEKALTVTEGYLRQLQQDAGAAATAKKLAGQREQLAQQVAAVLKLQRDDQSALQIEQQAKEINTGFAKLSADLLQELATQVKRGAENQLLQLAGQTSAGLEQLAGATWADAPSLQKRLNDLNGKTKSLLEAPWNADNEAQQIAAANDLGKNLALLRAEVGAAVVTWVGQRDKLLEQKVAQLRQEYHVDPPEDAAREIKAARLLVAKAVNPPWSAVVSDQAFAGLDKAMAALELALRDQLGQKLLGDGIESPSPAVQQAWKQQVQALTAASAQAGELGSRAAALRKYLLDVPAWWAAPQVQQHPAQWDEKAFAAAALAAGEQMTAAVLEATSWGKDGPALEATRKQQLLKKHQQWSDDALALLADTTRVEKWLQAGYAAQEQVDGASASTLAAQWRKHEVFPALAPAVKAVTDQLAAIEAAEAVVDRAQLLPLLQGGRSALPLQLAAWRALGRIQKPLWPADLAELDKELAFSAQLDKAAAGLADSSRRASLQSQIQQQTLLRVQALLTSLAQTEHVSVAFTTLTKAGFPIITLDPSIRFDYALWKFRSDLAALPAASEDGAVAPRLDQFIAQILQMPGDIPKKAPVASLLQQAMQLKQEKPRKVVGEVGPNAAAALANRLGWKEEEAADGGRRTFRWTSKRGTGYQLEFVLVPETESSFLCTTEMSRGLCLDLLSDLNAFDLYKELFAAAGRDGPIVWKPIPGSARLARSPQWLYQTASQLGDPAKQFAPGISPGQPDEESPMQRVTPELALAVARMLGFRLPTSGEWKAAFAAFEKQLDPAAWNLRDQSFVKQEQYVRQIEGQLRLPIANYPGEGSFRPAGYSDQPAAPADDQVLYFAPVAGDVGGSKHVLHHLVGNVAELVFDQPDAAQGLSDLSVGALQQFLDKSPGQLQVIGGSALTALPPQTPQPLAPANARPGFSDVGFRLAFTGPTPPLLARLQRLMDKQDYLALVGAAGGPRGGADARR